MAKSIEYYLSKGFDERAAQYFAGGRKEIIGVIPNDDFTLTISFENGEKCLYDVRPLLKKDTVYEHIATIESFRRVYVDDQRSIAWDIDPSIDSNEIWSNKVDLCPDACYIDSLPIDGC